MNASSTNPESNEDALLEADLRLMLPPEAFGTPVEGLCTLTRDGVELMIDGILEGRIEGDR